MSETSQSESFLQLLWSLVKPWNARQRATAMRLKATRLRVFSHDWWVWPSRARRMRARADELDAKANDLVNGER